MRGMIARKAAMMLTFMLLMLSAAPAAAEDLPSAGTATGNVLVISAEELGSRQVIPLDYEGEFYWEQLLEPDDFPSTHPLPNARRLSPLAKWRYVETQLSIKRHGFATYRFFLKVESSSPVTIIGHRVRHAIKGWIDGKLVIQTGTIGTSFDEEIPNGKPFSYTFIPRSGTHEIVLQVSNYHNTRGGGHYQLLLGHAPQVQDWLTSGRITDAFIVGSLIIMAFYHIGLWLMKRGSYEMIMFACFCFCIAIRSLSLDESWLIDFVFPRLSWLHLERLDYIAGSMAPPFMCQFFFALFPKEIGRTVVTLCWLICGAFSLDFLLMPPIIFGGHLAYVQILILIMALWCMKGIVQAALHRRDGAMTNVMGLVLLILTFLNDILIQYFAVQSVNLMPFGMLLFILFQAVSLSIQFHRAFEGEAKARREFEKLSAELEIQVEERTKTIATIINNVKSGFFLVGADMRVLPGYTQSCNRLLKLDLQVAKHLFDIFSLSERDRDSFEAGFGQIFDNNLPEAAALSNLKTRFQRLDRIYEVDGSVVRGDKGKVASLLFSVSDITELVAIEQENDKSRMLLRILNYKNSFRLFISDAYERCMKLKELIQKGNQNGARQSLHTIKGNAALFELNNISSLVHEVEEHESITVSDVEHLDHEFDKFMQENYGVIGFNFNDATEDALVVSSREVLQLRQSLREVKTPSDMEKAFNEWYTRISSVPVVSILGPIERSIKIMAEKIGKKVDFSLIGGDLKVDPARYGDLLHSLIHLIRNALDHGIEHAAARGSKSPSGHITLSFKDIGSILTIEVEDDGAGIDSQKLVEAAIASGQIALDAARRYDPDQALDLVFLPGISHVDKENLTLLSGRGYGMTAVKQAVDALGGVIKVKTRLGFGTTFTIKILTPGQYQTEIKELKAS
jgi:signal transduction histidine kinase